MILCVANAIPLLFQQVQKNEGNYDWNKDGFTGESLLFFEFTIDDLSKNKLTRNRLVAIRSTRRSFLLKQPRIFNRENVLTLRKEAIFTEKVAQSISLAKYLPKSFGYDKMNFVFFRAWWDDVLPVTSMISRNEDLKDHLALIQSVAKCLLIFHTELVWPVLQLEPFTPFFETNFPSRVFTFKKEFGQFYEITLNPESLRYVDYLSHESRTGLLEAIQRLGESWELNSKSIIHGDIKFDNILWNTLKRHVFLIDWELAMIGDPAWDVSGFLYPIIITFFDHTQLQTALENIKKWMAEFWKAYEASAMDKETSLQFQNRTIAYCGVRIIDQFITGENLVKTISEETLLGFGEEMIIEPETYVKLMF